MRPLILAVTAAVLCGAARGATSAERLAFHPAPGTKLTKIFRTKHALVVSELRQITGGIQQNRQDQIEVETKQRVEVTDEYRSVAGGRALAFRRSFDEISFVADATVPQEGADPLFDSLHATGPLRGTSVVFTWQPDEGRYGKYYDAEEADEEYLADLASDMDLLCLLPQGDVSAGDEWRIQPAALRDVLAAGGRMPLRYQRTGNVMLARIMLTGVGGALWQAFAVDPTGEVQARFDGVREEGGVRLGAVHLTVALESSLDQTAFVNRLRNANEMVLGLEYAKAELDLAYRGSGEMLWDIDAGLPHSLALSGDLEVRSRWVFAPKELDPDVRRNYPEDQSVSLIGTLEVGLETKRPE